VPHFPPWLAFELRDRVTSARDALLALGDPGVRDPAQAAVTAADGLLGELADLLATVDRDADEGERHTAEFRALALRFRHLEEVPLAFLLNLSESSRRMTALTAMLAREIGMERAAAAVSTAPGQPFFLTNTGHGLITVPPAQRGRLLVLPVLAHELAHLVWARELRDVEGWALATATSHARDQGSPPGYTSVKYGQIWTRWAAELACDFVAAYTCGPAHLRALLMLAAAGGAPPYGAEGAHPAEHVRVTMALRILQSTGLDEEAAALQADWARQLELRAYGAPPPELVALHPQAIVEQLLDMLYDRAAHLQLIPYADRPPGGCVQASADAFVEHSARPDDYPTWERNRLTELLRGG
jgi:hypothetical protein